MSSKEEVWSSLEFVFINNLSGEGVWSLNSPEPEALLINALSFRSWGEHVEVDLFLVN